MRAGPCGVGSEDICAPAGSLRDSRGRHSPCSLQFLFRLAAVSGLFLPLVCVCVCHALFWEREKQKVVLLWRLFSGGPPFWGSPSAPISYETLIRDSRGLALPGYLPPTLLLSPDPKCLPSSPWEGDCVK